MALPQVLDSHGLANEDPRCLHNLPMRDKKNVFSIFTKKKENGTVHETPHARGYSLQHFFSSFSKGKVLLLEIKNQTYKKLRQEDKKVKPFKCQGVWLQISIFWFKKRSK